MIRFLKVPPYGAHRHWIIKGNPRKVSRIHLNLERLTELIFGLPSTYSLQMSWELAVISGSNPDIHGQPQTRMWPLMQEKMKNSFWRHVKYHRHIVDIPQASCSLNSRLAKPLGEVTWTLVSTIQGSISFIKASITLSLFFMWLNSQVEFGLWI